MNTKKQNIIWSGLIFAVCFIIDRITKYYALHNFATSYRVNDFISFDLAFNRGISWSMFHSSNETVFFAVSGVIAVILCALIWHTVTSYRAGAPIIGEVLVLAGAVSNLIDRFMYQGVVDFISLSYGCFSWPIFNIADVCIVVGVGIMLIMNAKNS